jgi:hypothetical protein
MTSAAATHRSRRDVLQLVGLALLAAALAAGAWRLGVATAPTPADARSAEDSAQVEGYDAARVDAATETYDAAYADAFAAAAATGETEGAAAGRAAGRRTAATSPSR